MVPEQQRLLQTFAVLIASALERLHLARSAEEASWTPRREQLRNSLLAALSHDLRTPLTVLFGQAEILTRWTWRPKAQSRHPGQPDPPAGAEHHPAGEQPAQI
ncbi:hypothetical protein M8494_37510 [Serratia ureilytica]